MAHYTIQFGEDRKAIALQSPLTAVEAYEKIRELKSQGVKNITLRDYDTGVEITDVEGLLRDAPDA